MLRSALFRQGLRFRKHGQPIPGLRCHADVVFPTERVAVFVDGCFWHNCPAHGRRPRANAEYWQKNIERNRQRDRRNNERLEAAGWLVIRAWEHESSLEVAGRVVRAVVSRRAINGLRSRS
jgi:DNA mismatch endonuclease, patch repair protein